MWFIWFLLRIDDPQEALKRFFVVSKAAFIATLVLAGVTAIFSGVAVIAANGPQCSGSGYDLMEGYRTDDFVGLFLGSGFIALLVRAPGGRLHETESCSSRNSQRTPRSSRVPDSST